MMGKKKSEAAGRSTISTQSRWTRLNTNAFQQVGNQVLKDEINAGRGASSMVNKRARAIQQHLYKYGAARTELPKFQTEYGKEHGKYVYGAVIGKVKREQMSETGAKVRWGAGSS